MDPDTDRQRAYAFESLWLDELEEVAKSRQQPGRPSMAPRNDCTPRQWAQRARLTGLAFSGGGIRSATFNLGVLQALAKLGLLRRFDYLSTVSGGGYIGGWLAAWIQREKLDAVEKGLAPQPAAGSPATEHEAIHFLRRFSNYLTPKLGALSADTWSFAAVYLRNLLLNLLILVSAAAAVLLVPRLVVIASTWLAEHSRASLTAALACSLVALLFSRLNLSSFDMPAGKKPPWYSSQGWLQLLVALPMLLSAWFAACWLVAGAATQKGFWSVSIGSASAAFMTIWFLTWSAPLFRERGIKRGIGFILFAIAAGSLGGYLIEVLALLSHEGSGPSGLWHLVSWGTPLMVTAFSLASIAHIGLLGRGLPDPRREWWGRVGAWLIIYCLVWTGLFAVAVYAPLGLLRLDEGFTRLTRLGLSAGWVLSTLGGLLAGRSASTGKRRPSRGLEALAQLAPPVFIAGLLALVALGIHKFHLGWTPDSLASYWDQMAWTLDAAHRAPAFWWTAAGIAGLAAFALALSWRVDINQFSMHLLYRNRLARCYLGASRPGRRPQPSTGFDPDDDALFLIDLAPSAGYQGPYPIVNTALNLVQGEELAWQKRKAAAFAFTPRFSGYEVPIEKRAARKSRADACLVPWGYRPTSQYGYRNRGVKVGTAMAISGAAASPNMGYHTSSAVAFLMTVFNVRLGWWLSNPRHKKTWNVEGPHLGLKYLFGELFALTSDRSRYVYLSDGGHFENLGIYELIRRRCLFVVACDAGQDPGYNFEDLGNAIEKCRTDFNVAIEIDFEQLRPQNGGRETKRHCAVGRIRYDLVDPEGPMGTLLYIKSSLTGDEQGDVKAYAAEHLDFPHQSTADQWFDESQFESYRALGFHAALSVFEPASSAGGLTAKSNQELFLELARHWHAPSAAVEASFTRHAAALARIHDMIRSSPELVFLDAQIYPEWDRLMAGANHPRAPHLWLPPSHSERRAGFYAVNDMIQLMENVYIDLKLEQEYDHPDNRGWMNLFKHWSWSGMFRVVWAVSASTYGARFQSFCARRLGVDVTAKVNIGAPVPLEDARHGKTFNFFEEKLLAEYAGRHHPPAAEVYPLEILIEDAMLPENRFAFTFGFALVGRQKKAEGEAQRALLYFRVQDHLRNMGLSRKALAKLVELGVETAEPRPLLRTDEESISEEDCRRFKQLFDAVRAEVEVAGNR